MMVAERIEPTREAPVARNKDKAHKRKRDKAARKARRASSLANSSLAASSPANRQLTPQARRYRVAKSRANNVTHPAIVGLRRRRRCAAARQVWTG